MRNGFELKACVTDNSEMTHEFDTFAEAAQFRRDINAKYRDRRDFIDAPVWHLSVIAGMDGTRHRICSRDTKAECTALLAHIVDAIERA